MGNTPATTQPPSFIQSLSQNYQQLKKDSRGVVLLHKQTDLTYLLKQYVYPTQTIFRNKLKSVQDQINQPPRQFIINPVKVQNQVFNNFCSTSYKLYVLYEYPQVTLREQIMARKKQDKRFQQAELWSILQSCTNALSQLKPYISLNPNEIFINPDGNLKIIHDDIIDQNYRALISPGVYYAPEKLKSFNKQDNDLSLRKQSVFSMGMTILQAAQLQDISSCYNYNQASFDENQLEIMLFNLQDKCSMEFMEVLNNILEVNPNRRASLMEIQNSLDQYWSYQKGQQETQINKETMNDQNNGQAQTKQEILSQKVNHQVYSQNNYQNKSMNNQKQLTLNHSKKYVAYQNSAIQTPKNAPINKQNQSSLYTDPKLFEMIRKDLEQINKLKKSSFNEPSRYTFMYPQTQNILNSIKNMNNQVESSSKNQMMSYNTSQRMSFQQDYKLINGNQFRSNNYAEQYKMKQPRKSYVDNSQVQNMEQNHFSNRDMKKKNHESLVYVIQTYQNGSKYQGTTMNGLKEGYGKLTFEDGVYYEGSFKEDKMNGKGVLYYSMSQIAYDGQWTNDQFNGYGILYNENPVELDGTFDFSDFNNIDDYWIKYQGNFVLDNKCGDGKLYLTNGQILTGTFRQDFVYGHCRYTRVNGQRIQGYWEQNQLRELLTQQ